MKARPRRIENQVAEQLTSHFVNMGMSPVKRIPVLGRAGPDIDINESGLAIDVKSRKEVPLGNYRFVGKRLVRVGEMLAVKVSDFPLIYSDVPTSEELSETKIVRGYLEHMAEWANRNGCIPAIVIHRPGTRVSNAVFIIYARDREKLKEQYETVIRRSSNN